MGELTRPMLPRPIQVMRSLAIVVVVIVMRREELEGIDGL